MSWQEITKTHDLAVSERMLSDTLSAIRFDAEYFQPHYLENDLLISRKEYQQLGEIIDDIKSFGAYSLTNQISYQETGIPFIRCTDVKSGYVDFSQIFYINEKSHDLLWKSAVEKGTVILCMSGSVGNCAVAEDDWQYPINSNQDVAKITLKKNYDPYFFSAFLNSKYGRLQVMRLPIGSVQQHIFLWQLKTLKVPVASDNLQTGVSKVYRQSLKKRKQAELAFSEAEQLLLKEINLEGYVPSKENTSVRELSECLADNRFDAEYWEPRFDEMEERVSTIPQQELGDIVSIQKGIDPGSEAYTESGKSFVRVSDISIYGIEDGDKKISNELYEELKDNYKPQKGEVLFTKDGTIGISFALHEDIDAIVSSAFLRLKPKIKINIDYLTLVLNSLYCKFQIERMSGGAIIAHLKPESVKKIKVPVLSDVKQEELAEKAVSSLRLRNEAKELLEKAKRAVEIFIEKDEQEALKSLAA